MHYWWWVGRVRRKKNVKSLCIQPPALTWDSLDFHLDVGHSFQLTGHRHFQTADASGSSLSLRLPLLSLHALPHLKRSTLPEPRTSFREKNTQVFYNSLHGILVFCHVSGLLHIWTYSTNNKKTRKKGKEKTKMRGENKNPPPTTTNPPHPPTTNCNKNKAKNTNYHKKESIGDAR